jgi:hypothetical protein
MIQVNQRVNKPVKTGAEVLQKRTWSVKTERCWMLVMLHLQKDEHPLTGTAYEACLAAKPDGTQPG